MFYLMHLDVLVIISDKDPNKANYIRKTNKESHIQSGFLPIGLLPTLGEGFLR